MPIHKLAERLEQDVAHLCWQARIHQLSSLEVHSRYDKLAFGYRRVVCPEDQVALEALLQEHASRIVSS